MFIMFTENCRILFQSNSLKESLKCYEDDEIL